MYCVVCIVYMYCIFGGEKVKSERKGAQLCLCTGVNYIEVGVVDLVSLNLSPYEITP